MDNNKINQQQNSFCIIGAGLAGCECAWSLAEKFQQQVTLIEMKPVYKSPAHIESGLFAELVCSNSLKSKSMLNPCGVLKQEMRKMGSLILESAYLNEVPAGETLAVDRYNFATHITQKIKSHPRIKIISAKINNLAELSNYGNFTAIIIATGPLTEGGLAEDLQNIIGQKNLYFYDAIAPIINGDTLNMNIAFMANRQSRTQSFEKRLHENAEQPREISPEDSSNTSDGDYLNIPLNKDEYALFVTELLAAHKVPFHAFEAPKFFSGCQPIEVLAESGFRTLSFGPMKPKGLIDPRTQRMPWATLQLRKEKLGSEAYNMVGFQTRLTWPEQKRIFSLLPGMEKVEFYRFGSMHRNTYFVAPSVLNHDLSLRTNSNIYLSGQIMGVEGYLESSAMGLYIAHVLHTKYNLQKEIVHPSPKTALGSLINFLLNSPPKDFSPMNLNWGIIPALQEDELQPLIAKLNSDELRIIGGKKTVSSLDKSQKRMLLSIRAKENFNLSH